MSTPFMEMPQRAAASPCTTSRPPCAVAPADWLALPSTTTGPDIMFSATPVPALPRTRTRRVLVHARAVVPDVPVDLDLESASRPQAIACAPFGLSDAPARGPAAVAGDVVQALVQLAQRRRGEVDDLDVASAVSDRPSDGRLLPDVDDAGLGLPHAGVVGARAGRRSRATRRPSRPSRRSRRARPACRRSGRAARRSRRPSRRRRCRSRRGRRGSPRAPARATRPRAGATRDSRRRPPCRSRSGTRCPRDAARSRRRLWFESEPLWTRQRSRPVENGCEPSVVTRLSVAMRVWPSACVPVEVCEPELLGERPRAARPPCRSRSRCPALITRSSGWWRRTQASRLGRVRLDDDDRVAARGRSARARRRRTRHRARRTTRAPVLVRIGE